MQPNSLIVSCYTAVIVHDKLTITFIIHKNYGQRWSDILSLREKPENNGRIQNNGALRAGSKQMQVVDRIQEKIVVVLQ